MTVEVYRSPGGDLLASPSVTSGPNGQFFVNLGSVTIESGMFVRAIGAGRTKELLVTNVAISGVNREADTVAGTADAGSLVQVQVNERGGSQGANRLVAATDGNWQVDFTGSYDIGPATDVSASVLDEDGDSTTVFRSPPNITASLTTDGFWGNNFPPNSPLNIEVFGLAPDREFLDGRDDVSADQYGNFNAERVNVDLLPGLLVRVSGGGEIREVDLVEVTIDSFDPGTGIVSGTAPAGSRMDVAVYDDSHWAGTNLTAGNDGQWTADFSGEPWIGPAATVSVTAYEDDGDGTQVELRPVTLEANLTWNSVSGHGFPAGDVTINVYASVTPGLEPLESGTAQADGQGEFQYDLQSADLVPGMLVTATSGAVTKEVVLVALSVEAVDRDNDQVEGTAPTGTDVTVSVYDQNGGQERTVTAEGGTWTASFAGDPPYDIGSGTGVQASAMDADGDRTVVDRQPPWVGGNLAGNNIEGGWFAGSSVTVTVYDVDGTTILWSGPATSDPNDPGRSFWLDPESTGVNLVAGMTIRATDGIDTKEVTLAELTIGSVDPATDTVTGTAPAGARVQIDVWSPTGGDWTETTANGEGLWSATFGETGITGLSDVHASVQDGEGDRTDTNRAAPVITGNLTTDTVEGRGFEPGGTVTIEVYASQGGTLLASVPATVSDSGDFSAGLGRDLAAGQYLVVDDGTIIKTLTLLAVAVTSADAETNIVTGTAPAGETVEVGVFHPWEGASLTATADRSGLWSVDFSPTYWDLAPDDEVSATVRETDPEDADGTVALWAPSASSWTFENGILTIRIAGGTATIVRTGRAGIAVNGIGLADPTCGGVTVSTVDEIRLLPAGGAAAAVIDLSGGAFAPGATREGKGSEIEFTVDVPLTIQGGGGADTIVVGAYGIDLNGDGDADVTGAFSSEVLTIDGGAGNDRISAAGGGGTGAVYDGRVVLRGGLGNDTLTGGAANDDLSGGAGKDVLTGGPGENSLNGGEGVDRVEYLWSATGVTVSLGAGTASGAGLADSLSGIEDVTGSNAGDTLTGGAGPNTINGAGGDDTINVQDGTSGDTAVGGAGYDTVLADLRDHVRTCEA